MLWPFPEPKNVGNHDVGNHLANSRTIPGPEIKQQIYYKKNQQIKKPIEVRRRLLA